MHWTRFQRDGEVSSACLLEDLDTSTEVGLDRDDDGCWQLSYTEGYRWHEVDLGVFPNERRLLSAAEQHMAEFLEIPS